MKILVYNIDHGGREGRHLKKRWPKIIRAIKHSRPDILIILEAWGWRKDKELKIFTKKCGYKYFFLSLSNTMHHIALLSKSRPKFIKYYKRGLHHSLLEAQFVYDNFVFSLFGVHLYPFNEDRRFQEIKKLIPIIKKQRYALVMGDFNSLSPEDSYNKKKLIELFKKYNVTKFGENQIETKVMEKFLLTGFIDVVRFLSKRGIQYTVPTKMRTGEKHITHLRYDYAFATKNLLPRIKKVQTVKNKLTDIASDHYPLMVEIK